MNKKAAIELSVNFIVVIIISVVILSLGFILFFNLKDQAAGYVKAVDDQTQLRLKSLMLSSGDKIALFPSDFHLDKGDTKIVALAITNKLDIKQYFIIEQQGANKPKILYYKTSESDSVDKYAKEGWWLGKIGTQDGNIKLINNGALGEILPTETKFYNIQIDMPKTAALGQYVISLYVFNSTTQAFGSAATTPKYGVAKIYITVP